MNSTDPDDDNPVWTKDDAARAKPATSVLPEGVLANFRRGRGPQRAPTKQAVSIRLSPEVLDHYRAKGKGWQTKLDNDLRKQIAAKAKEAPHKRTA